MSGFHMHYSCVDSVGTITGDWDAKECSSVQWDFSGIMSYTIADKV